MLDKNTAQGYFVHLAKCALKNIKPQEKPQSVSFQEVYSISRLQKASNLLWESIIQLDNKPDKELLYKWHGDYALFLNQTVLQEIELESLIELFTGLGYEVLPLKGSLIRSYYPQPDMRSMGDIDLMVKTDMTAQARQKIRDIMHENGYYDDVLDDGQVDAFRKNENIYCEIHYEFMHRNHAKYSDFVIDWNAMPVDENNPLLHTMSPEDLYYYNIGHFTKNIYARGIGFRSVLDCYVLWNSLNEDEKSRVVERLKKIGLESFNNSLLKVGRIWFDDEQDDSSLDVLQEYLLSTYVYGIEKNAITLNLIKTQSKKKKSRINFYFSRIFPDANSLYNRFNIKHRIFVLLPFLWLLRLFLFPFSSREKLGNIKREVDTMDCVSQDYIDMTEKLFDEIGLEI